jgi:proteasome lid subunit RPN8/RPN11
VILSRGVHADLVAHARETAPAECCGLLIGAGQSITHAVRTRNVAADPNRFEIDPGDHIRARREWRARGLDVLGFYHSHPHSPALPSARDLAEALYPDHLYVIVSLANDQPDVRAYRLSEHVFEEESWTLE